MERYCIEVFIEFPGMPDPYRVAVSPQDLFILDRDFNRRVGPDGKVIYLPLLLPAEKEPGLEPRRAYA